MMGKKRTKLKLERTDTNENNEQEKKNKDSSSCGSLIKKLMESNFNKKYC